MVTFPGEKNYLAQGCTQHTSVPKPEGMTQLHLCCTEDRPASNHCSLNMQGRVWPARAGALPSMPRISGGGRTCASHGSPGTYQPVYCVVNQQIKKKVWGSLPGQRVQPDEYWFRNNVFQEGFKTSAWELTTKYQETSKEEVNNVYRTRFCMAEGFQGIPRA